MSRPRRLLSIGHSYVVALNRRLAHEMARAHPQAWEITAAAPEYFHGGQDLRPIPLERLTDEPCPLIPLPACLTRFVHTFLYGRPLRSLLAEGWDLVHCWEEPYVLAGGQIHRWSPPQTPVVFWTAQNLAKRYPPPFSTIERYCLRRCQGWLACGQTTLETQLPRGYDQKPHRILPLGVDVDHFRPDGAAREAVHRTLGWSSPGPPILGYLGRFVPEKGVSFLTRVLDELDTPWRALFVGGGPLETDLRRWATGHGDRVRLCTGVRHAEVPDYLNAMDVLCAPSQTTPRWREQFGRMLVEGFACGLAVVGSDSGEIPYVLGDSGVIVGETDILGWRGALSNLLESPSKRQEWGHRGRTRACEHYAWAVIARQHLEFFAERVEEPRV